MSDGTRRPYEQAKRDAEDLIAMFQNCAERWEIAGSIRRGKLHVGDVEHVVIPKWMDDERVMPGEMFPTVVKANLLFRRMDELVDQGAIEKAMYNSAHGPTPHWGKQKRGVLFRGFKHEFFIADELNWGAILAIRTGPAEFSHRMVAAMRAGGRFVQGGMNGEHRGYVCRQVNNEIAACRTEQEWFTMCGARYLEPHQRLEDPRGAAR